MKVLKTFIRDGKRYRPGDDAPAGLDALAIAHYERHGMLGQPPKPVRAARKTSSPPPPPPPPLDDTPPGGQPPVDPADPEFTPPPADPAA